MITFYNFDARNGASLSLLGEMDKIGWDIIIMIIIILSILLSYLLSLLLLVEVKVFITCYYLLILLLFFYTNTGKSPRKELATLA